MNDDEKKRLQEMQTARKEDFGYIQIQSTRPQTIAYSLTDSPVGQMTWIVEKYKEWTDPKKELPEDAVDIGQLLTSVSLYLRIRRVNEAMKLMDTGRYERLVDVANALHFYDQSHFIHDMKAFSVVTPKHIMQKVNDFHRDQVGSSYIYR